MNIVQSCIKSMRGFDLMDITRLFLVCMGIKICYYYGKYIYDCGVFCIGSCSSYIVSDLKNALFYSSLVFVKNFKFIYKIYFFIFCFKVL